MLQNASRVGATEISGTSFQRADTGTEKECFLDPDGSHCLIEGTWSACIGQANPERVNLTRAVAWPNKLFSAYQKPMIQCKEAQV